MRCVVLHDGSLAGLTLALLFHTVNPTFCGQRASVSLSAWCCSGVVVAVLGRVRVEARLAGRDLRPG
jgi:hypothetical protein